MSLPPNLVFVADTPEPKPIVPLYRMVQTKRDRNYWEGCNQAKSEWVTAQEEIVKDAEELFDALVKKLKIDNNIGANLKPGCWEDVEIVAKTNIIGGVIGGILGAATGAFMTILFGDKWKQNIGFEKLKEAIRHAEDAREAEAAFTQCCKDN